MRHSKTMETPLPQIFDESDLWVLLDAVSHKVRTAEWNIDDPTVFEALCHLKGLQARILERLKGGK